MRPRQSFVWPVPLRALWESIEKHVLGCVTMTALS
jgi:hypothetical protein